MAKVVPDVKKRTLQPIVAKNVEPGSTVHTDELRSYSGLGIAPSMEPRICLNGIDFVDPPVTFPGSLQKYVKEFEYRYNRRKRPERIFGIWWRAFS